MVTIAIEDLKFAKIQAIIFDKDGTLENSADFLRELAIKRARLIDAQIPGIGEPLLMAFGINEGILDATGLMAVGSHSENEIAAAAYIAETGRGWIEAKQIANKAFAEADKYINKQNVSSSIFPDSLAVLELLSAANLKLGILSADSTANVEEFVRSHQLDRYIQLAMGVDSGLNKPDPQLFIQACYRLGVEPAKTIMVGDSLADLIMAKEAGAAGTIGICWHCPNANHLRQADVTIASLTEIQILNPAKQQYSIEQISC